MSQIGIQRQTFIMYYKAKQHVFLETGIALRIKGTVIMTAAYEIHSFKILCLEKFLAIGM